MVAANGKMVFTHFPVLWYNFKRSENKNSPQLNAAVRQFRFAELFNGVKK